MDAASEQNLIRLWNRLRVLQKEGRPVTAVLRQIERALERDEFSLSRLGIRGPLSPDRRSRKAREVRFHLVEDE